ncbi:MAG TPA: hypothetical protein VIZ90_20810 [Rhizobiaceae bacterium]
MPGGTWIFTDHERLSRFELSLAARMATLLQQGGATVLNHPARVRFRFELLAALKQAGINRFSAWRCESMPKPGRFPVFIRSEFDHDSTALDLIATQQELDAAISRMQRSGVPLAGQLVIEYAGAEIAPGVWQRLATYRAGDAVIAHHNVVDFRWVAKDVEDKARLHSHPDYREFVANERRFVDENLHADVLRRAFELAGIDYGRADFSIVDGAPQIYEINTNPKHASRRALERETHPDRLRAQLDADNRMRKSILATDAPDHGPVAMDDPALRRQQRLGVRIFGLVRP